MFLQDIIDWFLVIRQAKILLLRQRYGEMDDEEVSQLHQENMIAMCVTLYRPESVHPRSTFIMDGCIRLVLVEMYVK